MQKLSKLEQIIYRDMQGLENEEYADGGFITYLNGETREYESDNGQMYNQAEIHAAMLRLESLYLVKRSIENSDEILWKPTSIVELAEAKKKQK